MPIFDFECLSCGKQFELLVKSRKEKVACIHCRKRTATRLPVLLGGIQGTSPMAKTIKTGDDHCPPSG